MQLVNHEKLIGSLYLVQFLYLIIYSLMAVVNNAGDLTSVLFGNVPTTVFIIPLFYLLTEDPRIEQLIKEWVPLLSLICFIASLASIIKFK